MSYTETGISEVIILWPIQLTFNVESAEPETSNRLSADHAI